MRAFTHGERGREREMHTDVRVVRKPPKWPRQWHGGILVAQDIRSGSFYGAPLFFPSPFSPSFGIKSADSTLRNAENTKLAHRKRGGYASRLRDLLIVRRVHPSLSPLHFLSFALCLSLYISAVCRHMRVADTCCVCLPWHRDFTEIRSVFLSNRGTMGCPRATGHPKENDSSALTCFSYSRCLQKMTIPLYFGEPFCSQEDSSVSFFYYHGASGASGPSMI